MAEMKKFLVLRLEGVLQAWGESSKWDFRDTSSMPSKSGIVGLLGCAMGEPRESAVLVELAQHIRLAVRADRAGTRFVDFQTVTGRPHLLAATGSPRTTGDTILSPHAYLQDACFTVFIETTDAWRERLVTALQFPKWCLYLGRKNCVPSRPVLECACVEYADWMDAIRQYPIAVRKKDELNDMIAYELDCPADAAASLLRSDELVGENRQFELRLVWRGVVKREVQNVSD